MADNSTVAATTAGVGTANNVQFASIISNGDFTINRADSSGFLRAFLATGGAAKWSYGMRGGQAGFNIFNEANIGGALYIDAVTNSFSIGYDTNSGAAATQPHKMFTNILGDNVLELRNFNDNGFAAAIFKDAQNNGRGAIGYGNNGTANTVDATVGCNFWETNNGTNSSPIPFVMNMTYATGINNKLAVWKNKWVVFSDDAGIGWTDKFKATLNAAKVVGMQDGSGNSYSKGSVIVGGTITGAATTGGGLDGGANVTGGYALHPPRAASPNNFPTVAGIVLDTVTSRLYGSGDGVTWRAL